jgi:hypothetical protein
MIVNYRAQNRLDPIEQLGAVIENYWCELPENAGKCCRKELQRGWMTFLQGGITLVEKVFYGERNIATQAVADTRAEICANCPYNEFPDKGLFVEWSDKMAIAATGGRRAARYDELGNCAVCTCPLKAKVWYRPHGKKITEGLKPAQLEQMRSVGCWQTTEDEKGE